MEIMVFEICVLVVYFFIVFFFIVFLVFVFLLMGKIGDEGDLLGILLEFVELLLFF